MKQTPPHVTIDDKYGHAIVTCHRCGTGLNAPPSFGGIPQAALVGSFVDQHRGRKCKA